MVERAGFWIRFVALLVDSLILSVVASILIAPLYLILGESGAGVGYFIYLIIALVYAPYFWVTRGATPGKQLLGLRVVSTTGGPLTVGQAIVRYLGYIVSGAVCYIGFIWAAFDDNKQGWHDKIANTYVIKSS